jgi:hypothetical protein
MYEIVERGVTEQERRRLLGCLPALRPAAGNWRRKLKLDIIAQVGGFGTGPAAAIWISKHPVSFVIPFVLVCWALYWVFMAKKLVLKPLREERERNRAANERLAKFRNAVNVAKTVRVRRVEAQGVVEVMHDEGVDCLFDLEGKRTYWFHAIGLMPGRREAGDDWPNSRFEIVELPGWQQEQDFGPFCYGEQLRPRETVEFRDYFAEYDFDKVAADGLIDKPVDVFLREARAESRGNLAKNRAR